MILFSLGDVALIVFLVTMIFALVLVLYRTR